MALKKPNSAATTAVAFEQEPGVDASVAEHSAPPVDAGVSASTAIATAAVTSLGAVNEAAAKAKAFKKEVEAMQGAADFSFGTHRVFKAVDGEIKEKDGDKVNLGKWVKVRLLAWDRHYEISPGEDGASSAAFVAYSRDGVTVDTVIGEDNKKWEGKPALEYLEHLRTVEEFEKASMREFCDTQVAAMGSEGEPDFTGVIQVTLASSSIPAFKNYQTKLEAEAKCVAMGLPGYALPADPFTFYFIREAAEKGKNRWTKLRIAATLPAKV
jgi:hypothetical protein